MQRTRLLRRRIFGIASYDIVRTYHTPASGCRKARRVMELTWTSLVDGGVWAGVPWWVSTGDVRLSIVMRIVGRGRVVQFVSVCVCVGVKAGYNAAHGVS